MDVAVVDEGQFRHIVIMVTFYKFYCAYVDPIVRWGWWSSRSRRMSSLSCVQFVCNFHSVDKFAVWSYLRMIRVAFTMYC